MEDLSKKIKQLREEKGVSPEQLATEIGFAKSTVWAYESGKKQVSVSHLARLGFADGCVAGTAVVVPAASSATAISPPV